ncbi:MAG: hypothetical protein WB592_08515 [Acidimicrobiales bacterium]
MTKPTVIVVVAVGLAFLSGCGSTATSVTTSTTAGSSSSSSVPSSVGASTTTSSLPSSLVGDTVLWKGTVSIQGASTVSESWAAGEDLTNLNTGARLDCTQAAAQTDATTYIGSPTPIWNIPEPASGISMIPYGNTPVTVDVDTDVNNYKGPGTYTQAAGGGGGVTIGAAALSSGNFNYWIDPSNGTTWKLVVNSNGSGSFTFAKAWAGGDEATSGPSISGTVTWTCQNVSSS